MTSASKSSAATRSTVVSTATGPWPFFPVTGRSSRPATVTVASSSRSRQSGIVAGLDDYDPDEVPPATDEPPTPDVTQSDEYEEARAEIRREYDEGELEVEGERDRFPPTRYDE